MNEISEKVRLANAKAVLDALNWIADRSLPVPLCTASAAEFEGPIYALSSIAVGDHSWWDRVWTVQEAILPTKTGFLWGPFRLSWDTLTECSKSWTTGLPAPLSELQWNPTSPDLSAIIDRTLEWLFCNVIWINSAHTQFEEPVQTIIKWCGRKATDPKDKVFGLLGLLSHDTERRLLDTCGYETPVAQIYSAFTMDVILDQGDLLPLVVQQRASPGNGTEGLPTWVCHMGDSEFRQMPHQVDKWYLRWGSKGYDACGGRKLDIKSSSEPCSEMKTLILTGAAVDTITTTGTRLTDAAAKKTATIAETLRSWMKLGIENHASITGGLTRESFAKVFYRVVVSDRIRNEEQWVARQPDEEDLEDIREFIETGRGTVNGIDFWHRYIANQIFFITKNGMMGLGHWETEIGDEVWVFDGRSMPFTIRKKRGGSEDDSEFVGCCYVHGIPDGEIYDEKAGWVVERRIIKLH